MASRSSAKCHTWADRWVGLGCVLLLSAALGAGCGGGTGAGRASTAHVDRGQQRPSPHASAGSSPAARHEEAGKHKAAHGGSLNAIVTCEQGHAEVKVEGDKLQLWLVAGGADTDRSVRSPDPAIELQVQTTAGPKTLVLQPAPLELAGERVGDCSCFEGTAAWLRGLASFTARGQVTFRGQPMPLRVEYPEGYDPD